MGLSSMLAGLCGFPGHAYYHAGKFAVEGFTESVAREVHPGWNGEFELSHLLFLFVCGGVLHASMLTVTVSPPWC